MAAARHGLHPVVGTGAALGHGGLAGAPAPLGAARRIVAKGVIVGLWSIRRDAGRSVEAYAERMIAMADQIGEDHVAFGTDATGIPTDQEFALFADYANLRGVVDSWVVRKVPESRMRKMAIGNYARVLVDATGYWLAGGPESS